LIHNRDGLIDIFVNHELALDKVNEYAKVSKITVDENGRIISGELIEDGSGKYERFCSATIFTENRFKNPLFVTNEEIEEGIVVAYDIVTKNKTEMPWLGKFPMKILYWCLTKTIKLLHLLLKMVNPIIPIIHVYVR
jgi:hypothetical protein